jgi:hypothetical protein
MLQRNLVTLSGAGSQSCRRCRTLLIHNHKLAINSRAKGERGDVISSDDQSSPVYKVEQGVIAFGGFCFLLIGMLVIYSRRFPWNADKANTKLVAYAHFVVLTSGILLIIWSVDPRLLYGFYPLLFVLILKDFLTLLLISIALLYSQVIYCVLMESRMHDVSFFMKNSWLSVGIPMVCLGVINIVTSVISIQTNQEVYRAIFFCSVGAVMAIADIYSIAMFVLLKTNQKTLKKLRSHSSIDSIRPSENIVKGKMKRSFIFLAAVFILQFYMAVDTLIARRSLTQSQVPDPAKYHFFMTPFIYFGGLTVCVIHSWLPFKKTSQTAELKLSTHSSDQQHH